MNSLINILSTLFFAGILGLSNLHAEHIISGVMNYEFVGPGSLPNTSRYKISLQLFSDCGIDRSYENSIEIGIYKGTPGSYKFYRKITAPVSNRPVINDVTGSCAQLLKNTCVSVTTYSIDVDDLETISENYLFAYQRCCRNMTISNILDPGRTGSTIFIEMTPESQQAKNSSPHFDPLNLLVACVNEPMNLKLNGTDAENDNITYELCAPVSGGGPRGLGGSSGNPSECNGTAPNPALCVPALNEIAYSNTAFTVNNPFPSKIPIVFTQGVLQAEPTTLGQYIFGVCIKEYRNGLLLSNQRRDVQINFAACNIVIKAAIKDAVFQNNIATLTNCDPDRPFKITNLSTDSIYLKSVRWEFIGPKKNIISSDSFHFVNLLGDTGMYTGKLILNRGNNCSDSLAIQIKVGRKLNTNSAFPLFVDSCSLNQVFPGSLEAQLKYFKWDFGDGNMSSDSLKLFHQHTYAQPGTYKVSLKFAVDAQCTTEILRTIRLFPLPADPILNLTDSMLCYPGNFRVGIKGLADSTYTYKWTLSDNRSFSGPSPIITVNAAGNLKISLVITSPVGCSISKSFPQSLVIVEKPKAAFTANQTKLTLADPLLILSNTSTKANQYRWNIGRLVTATSKDTMYTFTQTGSYPISLLAISENGCTDSTTMIVQVGEAKEVYVPNVFTPNDDGENDVFKPEFRSTPFSNYQMIIYDRWGQGVFVTNDYLQGWNGSTKKNKPAAIGVYIYLITYTTTESEKNVLKGSVTLIR